jgi:hypothetical protein
MFCTVKRGLKNTQHAHLPTKNIRIRFQSIRSSQKTKFELVLWTWSQTAEGTCITAAMAA